MKLVWHYVSLIKRCRVVCIFLEFPHPYLFFPSKHVPQAFTAMQIKTTASGVGSLFYD